MALTRPKIWDLDTNIEYFMDPLTVLHQGSTQANLDVGFIFNRANGLVSNVALYWSEVDQSFVTAFTSDGGVTNSNVSVGSYANLTVGSVLTINGAAIAFSANAGILINGSSGSSGQVLTSSGTGGLAWAAPGGFLGGTVPNQLIANASIASTSTTTGALTVPYGGVGIAGNLNIGGNVNIASTLDFVNPFINSVQIAGGINVLKTAFFGSNVIVNVVTDSVSTSTGALIVAGGAGIGGNVYAGALYDNGNRALTSVGISTGYGLQVAFSAQFGSALSYTINNSGVTGLSSSGTGNITVSANNGNVAIQLPATGPGATTAGSSTAIPVITTDAYGRISALTTASVSTTINLSGTSGSGSVSGGGTLTFSGLDGVAARVSGSTVTIDTPQNLQTTATPTFAGLTVNGLLQTSSGQLYVNPVTNQAELFNNTGTAGITVGTTGTSVTGNIDTTGYVTVSNGFYSQGSYIGSYADGIVVDYTVGTGRLSVGGSDGFGFYNSGPGGNLIFSISAAGAEVVAGSITAPSILSGSIGNSVTVFTGSSISTTTAAFTTAVSTNFSSGNAVISGGSIDGSPIGVTKSSTGAFTILSASGATTLSSTLNVSGTVTVPTISASGTVNITNTTQSSSTATGALTVAGGVGIGGNLYIGGNINIAGNSYVVNTTISNEVAGNLLVGAPLSFAATNANIQYGGNQNSFLQLLMQNENSGSSASTDFVATADNGNNNDTYIDMGINSSTYSQAGYSSNYPNDGYLYVQGNTTTGGGNLIVATMTDRDIIFATNGQNTNNIVARITAGNVVNIVSTNAATNNTSGALQVAGGVGIAGAAYAGSVYDNGGRVITSVTVTAGTGMSGGGTISGPSGSVTLTNAGVTGVTAGAGISTSASTGAITITNTGVTSAAAGTGISVSASTGAVTITNSGVTGLSSSGAGNLTVSASTGSITIALPATGPGAASVGSSTAIPVITTDAYGRISATSTAAVIAPAGTLSGSTLASGVTASSLTSVGTIGTGVWQGSIISPTYGGTGINNGSNTLTLSGSYTLNQSVASGSSPTFSGANFSSIPNGALTNSSITVTAGTGLSGGGAVSLGGSVTLTNAGVTSLTGGTAISVSASTGGVTVNNTGVTSLAAGTGISVNASTGGITVTNAGVTSIAGTANQITASASTGGVTLSLPNPISIGASWTGGTSVSAGYYQDSTNGAYRSIVSSATTNGYYFQTNGGTTTTMYVGLGGTYNGYVGVGTTTPATTLQIVGTTTAETIVPSANVTYNLGSTTAWWATIYGTSTHAQYADLAENYTSDVDYPPGTVVVFGGTEEITTTTTSHDPRVAGVISSDPAYLMNAANNGLPVAFTGRVPCLVQGPVSKGQVLVTSTTPGVAQAIDNSKFVPGCVLGKSLGEIGDTSIRTIEVVVGRF